MMRTMLPPFAFLLSLLITSCDAAPTTSTPPVRVTTTNTSIPTSISTSTPPTICTDIPPTGTSCQQFIGGTACSTLIAQGKCLLSCGACTAQPNPAATNFGPQPTPNITCNDIVPPPQPFVLPLSCAQYFAAGSCGLPFMKGFCRLTCGNCTIPTVAPAALSGPPPMMMMSNAPALVLVGAIGIITVVALVIAGVLCYIWHRRRISDVMLRVRGVGLLSQRSNTNLLSSNGSITPGPTSKV